MTEKISLMQLIFGFLALVTSLGVVFSRNSVVSAALLMATLFLTGGLYLGLGHFFIGAVQILIYAGAISVLFIFIVMLLDLKPFFLSIPGRAVTRIGALVGGGLTGFVLIYNLFLSQLGRVDEQAGSRITTDSFANPKSISLMLLSKYQIPFQVAGLMILAAVMGVVLMGKPKRKQESV